jgi:hypothetical protein
MENLELQPFVGFAELADVKTHLFSLRSWFDFSSYQALFYER